MSVAPRSLDAYAALMACVTTCPRCGAAVLRPLNGVMLDPAVVDASEPVSMTLGAIPATGGGMTMLATSSMPGQPAHRLHVHQDDVC